MNNGDEIYQFIRRRLRLLRLEHRLTQKKLAQKIGIAVSTYNAIENGAQRIRTATLYRLLEALDIDIEDVWPRRGATRPPGPAALTNLYVFDRANAFRFREIVLHSDSRAAALFLEIPHCTSCLAWMNISLEKRQRLARRLTDPHSPGSVILHRRRGMRTLHLYLEEPFMERWIRQMAETYLSLWLASRIFQASLPPTQGMATKRS